MLGWLEAEWRGSMRRKVPQAVGRPAEIYRKTRPERGSPEEPGSRDRLKAHPRVPKNDWFGFSGTVFGASEDICVS